MLRLEAHHLLTALATHNRPVADPPEQRVPPAQEPAELRPPTSSQRPWEYLVLVLVHVLFNVRGQVKRQIEVVLRVLLQVEFGPFKVREHHG